MARGCDDLCMALPVNPFGHVSSNTGPFVERALHVWDQRFLDTSCRFGKYELQAQVTDMVNTHHRGADDSGMGGC
jgi:hypothetical protein